jgi:cytosine/adenosine deaminase-related metal-dependent hydrolase
VALPDALRFASTYPARFLGLEHMLGKLAPGYRADLVAFDPTDITFLRHGSPERASIDDCSSVIPANAH